MSRMRKSKSHKKGFLRRVKNVTSRALPAVESGLNTVGTTVKKVAVKSEPTVKRGVSDIYGVLATGFNMGVKGVKRGVSLVSKRRRSRRHRSRKH